MPQLDFDVKFKSDQAGSFPRLKLEKEERARVFAGLEKPTYAYVHNLRAPKISSDGRPEYAEVRGQNQLVKEFLSRPLCFGDDGILREKGVDGKNCIMCKASLESDQVDPPQRRWALHIIKYATRPGSFDLMKPVSCQLQIWGFTDLAFNQLVDIATEWSSEGKSGLLTHDLLLGPCESKEWQKFKIAVASTAAVALDENVKRLVVETYRENRVTKDLEQFCGRKVGEAWVQSDLERIAERWQTVRGVSRLSDGTDRAEQRSLSEGLSGLLNTVDVAPPKPVEQPVDLGAMIPEAQPARNGSAMSFEDILNDQPTQTDTKSKDSAGDEFDQLLNL